MIIGGRRVAFFLFVGDIATFIVALYLTLWLRYLTFPNTATLAPYVIPSAFLFLFWTLVFYSAGLYSKRLTLFPNRLADALFKTQLANILFAALFFFSIPALGITPKTILVLYLIISLALIFFWRLTVFPFLSVRRSRERAVLIANGKEANELFIEVNGNPRYGVEFCIHVKSEALADTSVVLAEIERTRATMLVIDLSHTSVPHVSNLARRYQLVAFEDMYEEVFDRIPLSQLGKAWFRENVVSVDPFWYVFAKRCIDIMGGIVMGLLTIVIAPCIFVANLFEGSGPLFLKQERLGRYGTRMMVYKFRSMQKSVIASSEWTHEGENRVTKVGAFLRRTSLDEFPQFIHIITGDLSLIGPRSDIRGLGERLTQALPYYEARYMVVPGITGWAQINQQYEPGNVSPQSIEETKVRLAYDFYYLKHRSLGLDTIIALRTIKRMFFRLSSW